MTFSSLMVIVSGSIRTSFPSTLSAIYAPSSRSQYFSKVIFTSFFVLTDESKSTAVYVVFVFLLVVLLSSVIYASIACIYFIPAASIASFL